MSALAESPALKALRSEARSDINIGQLFAADAQRAQRLTFKLDDGLLLDLSKQQITPAALTLLVALARQQDVERQRDAMFRGAITNPTEKRPVLHMALRQTSSAALLVDGVNVTELVQGVKKRMASFATNIRTGAWLGATGQTITTIIHLGIGGSHLGPEMAVKALRNWHDGPAVRFVANVDPAAMAAALKGLDPARTLFIVASKTFTTQETLANARAGRAWLVKALGEAAVAKHFVACSTNKSAVQEFGIDPANMFEFWDWVGGRYSLWSAIGLPIMLAVGPAAFDEFLGGAAELDQHFKSTALESNLPVLLALATIWNRNILGRPTRAVLPYAEDLSLLPLFLQQLEMESNGKCVERDGEACALATSPVVFGQAGTNGQHAFYQMMHQGTDVIPAEFIVTAKAHVADEALAPGQHRLLVLNAIAQSAALLQGRASDEPHKRIPGNRPSTTIWLDELSPRALGRLIALYEHKTAVEGWLLNINSFDQFGVELGKKLVAQLEQDGAGAFDASTQALLARL